ncbi:MAG: NUDIX domain-containing protein, partial [Bacteroidota bacterium]
MQPNAAATVLIGRENNEQLEVLLLRRNRKLAFAGGLWVFPGGKIDSVEIAEYTDELAAARAAAVR